MIGRQCVSKALLMGTVELHINKKSICLSQPQKIGQQYHMNFKAPDENLGSWFIVFRFLDYGIAKQHFQDTAVTIVENKVCTALCSK